MRVLPLPCLLAAALALGGCTSTLGLMTDERSGTRTLQDINSSRAIEARMARADGYYLSDVSVSVTEGVALLGGEVPRPQDKIEAERIAWTADTVSQVGNEIRVGGRDALADDAQDALITQQVRARLLADTGVRSVNYNVETLRNVVYLMGVARSAAELDRAARIASLVPDVEKVVTYVRVDGEMIPGERPGAGPSSP